MQLLQEHDYTELKLNTKEDLKKLSQIKKALSLNTEETTKTIISYALYLNKEQKDKYTDYNLSIALEDELAKDSYRSITIILDINEEEELNDLDESPNEIFQIGLNSLYEKLLSENKKENKTFIESLNNNKGVLEFIYKFKQNVELSI